MPLRTLLNIPAPTKYLYRFALFFVPHGMSRSLRISKLFSSECKMWAPKTNVQQMMPQVLWLYHGCRTCHQIQTSPQILVSNNPESHYFHNNPNCGHSLFGRINPFWRIIERPRFVIYPKWDLTEDRKFYGWISISGAKFRVFPEKNEWNVGGPPPPGAGAPGRGG